MKKTSRILVYFGSGPVAAASLQNLINNFEIELVITKSKRHGTDSTPVEDIAKLHDLNIQFADSETELNNLFENYIPNSPCGIVIDYGVFIGEKVLNTFKLGVINSHFSLLPEWRGADPITYSLLSGQKTTGVCLMVLSGEIDTGKIIASNSVEIKTSDNSVSLTDKLISASNKLINTKLSDYIDNKLIPHEQNNKSLCYSRKIYKKDGQITWNKPASVIEREIRAFNIWPKSYFTFKGLNLIITKAKLSDLKLNKGQINISDDKKLSIGCSEQSLEIIELKPSGKKNMTAREFLVGYSNLLT